jgi:hypothetical protein
VAPVQEREEEIRKYALSHLIIVASGAFVFGIMLTIGLYLCIKSCRSFRKFDLERERKKNQELNNGKRKCGSLSSQLSLDFLNPLLYITWYYMVSYISRRTIALLLMSKDMVLYKLVFVT